MSGGQMLLAGFSGLFTKVEVELSSLYETNRKMKVPDGFDHIDLVQEQKNLKVALLFYLLVIMLLDILFSMLFWLSLMLPGPSQKSTVEYCYSYCYKALRLRWFRESLLRLWLLFLFLLLTNFDFWRGSLLVLLLLQILLCQLLFDHLHISTGNAPIQVFPTNHMVYIPMCNGLIETFDAVTFWLRVFDLKMITVVSILHHKMETGLTFGWKDSRLDRVKFVEDSL